VAEARGQLNLSRWMQYNPFDRAEADVWTLIHYVKTLRKQ
jgi:hypothetical protein